MCIISTSVDDVHHSRVAQCIDKEILIRKIRDIDIGIDIDKENLAKLIRY